MATGAMFGVSRATAHRRFTEWTASGLWVRLHQQLLHQLSEIGKIDWSRAVVDAINVRAEKGAYRPAQTQSIEANPARDPGPVRPYRHPTDRLDLGR
ncbi:DDE transposase family protein [Couchioplanes caeruleus]|uniref:Uncharacterized protein n=1 Tax=Couchioplanes caeruleus subsp. caeruleus TaxID=56427 RepID=A0A1K0GM44_9ACTN|nr:DDE transposase family protein [Couchioplanes caeruleus]OJF12132.1 hypothetical protein BG844_22230 [Couchioplanes caeruleus subsp. caeruleus]